MKQELNEIEINGVKYIRKDSEHVPAEKLDGMPFCVVRTINAGVFVGYVKDRPQGLNNATLVNSRRLWQW